MKISTASTVALGILWEFERDLRDLPANWSLSVKDAPDGTLYYLHAVNKRGVKRCIELVEEGRRTPDGFREYLSELARRHLQNKENRSTITAEETT